MYIKKKNGPKKVEGVANYTVKAGRAWMKEDNAFKIAPLGYSSLNTKDRLHRIDNSVCVCVCACMVHLLP